MSDNSDEAATESASDGANRSRKYRRVVTAAVVGVLAVAAVAAFVALNTQPTAITRAGDACSGAKPLDAFFDSIRETSSPQPDSEPTDAGRTEALDDLFDDVVLIEDDGTTLIINTAPKDDDPLGVTSLALDCVYEQLEVPAHIRERIGATRSLDGRQDGAWREFSASWSYHPDTGANVIIVQD